jgi:hypothetical protein
LLTIVGTTTKRDKTNHVHTFFFEMAVWPPKPNVMYIVKFLVVLYVFEPLSTCGVLLLPNSHKPAATIGSHSSTERGFYCKHYVEKEDMSNTTLCVSLTINTLLAIGAF